MTTGLNYEQLAELRARNPLAFEMEYQDLLQRTKEAS